jgi:hypothetical protein
MKKLALLVLLISFITSCKDDKTPLLIGEWRGTSWTVGGKESGRNAFDVKFTFNADGTYAASWGEQAEKGVFRLRSDGKLYTTADAANKIEKMVMLSTVTADTLVMDMNRVGDAEKLTLEKLK